MRFPFSICHISQLHQRPGTLSHILCHSQCVMEREEISTYFGPCPVHPSVQEKSWQGAVPQDFCDFHWVFHWEGRVEIGGVACSRVQTWRPLEFLQLSVSDPEVHGFGVCPPKAALNLVSLLSDHDSGNFRCFQSHKACSITVIKTTVFPSDFIVPSHIKFQSYCPLAYFSRYKITSLFFWILYWIDVYILTYFSYYFRISFISSNLTQEQI